MNLLKKQPNSGRTAISAEYYAELVNRVCRLTSFAYILADSANTFFMDAQEAMAIAREDAKFTGETRKLWNFLKNSLKNLKGITAAISDKFYHGETSTADICCETADYYHDLILLIHDRVGLDTEARERLRSYLNRFKSRTHVYKKHHRL